MEQEQNLTDAQKQLKELVAGALQSLHGFVALGQSTSLRLDYTIDSLDEVEKLLVAFRHKAGFEQLKADAWLYIGESICKSLGGQWKVSNDLRSYRMHYMLPVVTGFSKFNDEYCPMIEIDKFLDDNKQPFFKATIQAMRTGTYRYT